MKICWCGNNQLENYSEDYWVCRECGTLVSKMERDSSLYKVKDESLDLYGKNYWSQKMLELSGEKNLDGLITQYLDGRVLYWMKYILKYIPLGSSVAEVGCGLGVLPYVMRFAGYQQMAYEISPQICDFIREEMKVNVVCGEFGSKNEIYEAILSFDLLEHLIDPKHFVYECASRLWGLEIMCCQTPCYTEEWSYEEMLIRKPEFKQMLVPEQHIYLFSKRSIMKLLAEMGLHYVQFEPPAFGEYYDMFFFASKKKIRALSEDEIKQGLATTEYGRIVDTLLRFYNRLNPEQMS